MRLVSRPSSAVKAIPLNEVGLRRTRQIIVAFAAASAVALCSLAMAHADTWVTVNPDGSVTRTQTNSSASQRDNGNRNYDNRNNRNDNSRGDRNGDYNRYPDNDQRGQVVNTTTIYSGTLYPVPYAYPYYNPGGVTYNIGPQIPNFQSPTITTLPSTGYTYGYPAYGYPAYSYQPYGYAAPNYPYPLYGSTGTYYSGPAGGGGTIYSSTTTTNNGFGLNIGNGGYNVRLGNRTNTTTNTTTVTTTR